MSQTAVDALAAFKVAPARKVAYTHDAKAKRAPVAAISDAAFVTRGIRTRDEAPVLLVQDGSTQTAMLLPAIGAAIAGGVITREEIAALLGES